MYLFTYFLLIVFLLVVLFLISKSLLNSRFFRIALISHQQKQKEKELQEEILKQKTDIENIKNPDRFLDIILKIKRGEKVKIPLEAFTYIYKNIDKYTVVDKDNNLTFINQEDFFRFRKLAQEKISNSTVSKIDMAKIQEDIKNIEATKPIEILEYNDGTIVKKDHLKNQTEILRPTGEKVIIDFQTDTILEDKPMQKNDEDENTHNITEYAKQKQKEEREKQKLEQENKILKDKIKQSKQTQNQISMPKEIENKSEKNDNQIVEKPKASFTDLIDIGKKINNKENKEKELINKNKEKVVYDDNNPLSPGDFYFTFINSNDFYNTHITLSNVSLIVPYILTLNKDKCFMCVLYDTDINCILINVNWLAYKIWYLIRSKDEKETFLENYYNNVEIGSVNNDFLSNLIKKINSATKLAFGFKILYQIEDKDKIINFKSIKFEDKNEKLYQGIYLHLFLNNKFGKDFKTTPEFEKISSFEFKKTDRKGVINKIYFSDILEQNNIQY